MYRVPVLMAAALVLLLLGLDPDSAGCAELITAFGDSITEGVCRGVCHGYFEVLDTIMDNSGRQVDIINGGLGGETTSAGVSRIDIFLADNPDYTYNNHCPPQTQFNGRRGHIILIMEGANDAIHGVSAYTAQANLRIMIQKSRNAGVTPVLATITPNYKYGFGSCNSGIVGSYNTLIRQLATSEGVTLADVCNATDASWGSMTCEGLHPTYDGDVVIANTFFAVMPPPVRAINGALLLLLGQ